MMVDRLWMTSRSVRVSKGLSEMAGGSHDLRVASYSEFEPPLARLFLLFVFMVRSACSFLCVCLHIPQSIAGKGKTVLASLRYRPPTIYPRQTPCVPLASFLPCLCCVIDVVIAIHDTDVAF